MASSQDPNSPVVVGARSCMELLQKLVKLSVDSDVVPKPDAVDVLGRFKLWAGNMGALHSFTVKTSLDFRLRENPKVSNRITELLEELNECVGDACSIASNERENRTGTLESQDGSEDEAGEEDEEMSEIEEIFKSIIDIIANLFRFSAIIRDNSKRDRYAKAEAAAALRHPLDDHFDIGHVRHKFPALQSKGRDWLVIRLGKAITQRRKYLWYCREHHQKTQMGSQPAVPTIQESNIPAPSRKFGLDTRTVLSKPTSTLAPTQASSLLLTTEIAPEPEPEEDTQSQTSYATSVGQDEEGTKLQVVPLETVSNSLPNFECPYCWQIQTIKTQKSWKKHVLSDLKSYVCTFKDCDLTMFPDHHTWFLHELKDHRKKWKCHFCTETKVFLSSEKYTSHLKHHHSSSFIKEQLPTILEISQKSLGDKLPPDCPFCEDWESKLRKINPHIDPSEEFFVTPSQFKHHVGAHMEQLALFAIPRARSDDRDLDSAKSEGHSINSLQNIGNLSSRALSSRELSSFAGSVQSKNSDNVSVADTKKRSYDANTPSQSYGDSAPSTNKIAPATENPKVIITIRGKAYDTTDLKLDAEFLESLSEDLREEAVRPAVTYSLAGKPDDYKHPLVEDLREIAKCTEGLTLYRICTIKPKGASISWGLQEFPTDTKEHIDKLNVGSRLSIIEKIALVRKVIPWFSLEKLLPSNVSRKEFGVSVVQMDIDEEFSTMESHSFPPIEVYVRESPLPSLDLLTLQTMMERKPKNIFRPVTFKGRSIGNINIEEEYYADFASKEPQEKEPPRSERIAKVESAPSSPRSSSSRIDQQPILLENESSPQVKYRVGAPTSTQPEEQAPTQDEAYFPCEFGFLGCNETTSTHFLEDDMFEECVDKWALHCSSHFAPFPPPLIIGCPFCDQVFDTRPKPADVHINFRERIRHMISMHYMKNLMQGKELLDPHVLECLWKRGLLDTEKYTDLRRQADMRVTVTPHYEIEHGEDEDDVTSSGESSGKTGDSDDEKYSPNSRVPPSLKRSTVEKFKAYLKENAIPNRINGRLGSEFDDEWVSIMDLYLAVHTLGVYAMLGEQQWTNIAMELYNGNRPDVVEFGEDLKRHYERYCLPFDEITSLENRERRVESAHKNVNDGFLIQKEDDNPISAKKIPEIPNEPKSLSEEIIDVHELFPQITWEYVNVDEKVVKISVMGPWGENDKNICIKVTIVFPFRYPQTTSPTTFTIAKDQSISNEAFHRLKRELRQIASVYTSRQQGCLEPTLLYLIGNIGFETATNFRNIQEISTAEKAPSETYGESSGKSIPDPDLLHFPCQSLAIGSWRVADQESLTQTIFYSTKKAMMGYLIDCHDMNRKIEIPFSFIKQAYFAPEKLDREDKELGKYAPLAVELHQSPNFFREDDDGSEWIQSDDFTRQKQASKILVHYLGGDQRIFGQLLTSRFPTTDHHSAQKISATVNEAQDGRGTAELATALKRPGKASDESDITGTSTEKRLKVYELRGIDWIEVGSGFCKVYFGARGVPYVVAWDDAQHTIFEANVLTPFAFKKEQDTAIKWKDPISDIEKTLSFQTAEGCTEVWGFISNIRNIQEPLDRIEETNDGDDEGASTPPFASQKHKVKVFELQDEQQVQKGIGHCTFDTNHAQRCYMRVESELDPKFMLFEARLGKPNRFWKQQDTIINWTNPATNVKIALRFADPEACTQIWDNIMHFRDLTNVPENQAPVEPSPVLDKEAEADSGEGLLDMFERRGNEEYNEEMPASSTHGRGAKRRELQARALELYGKRSLELKQQYPNGIPPDVERELRKSCVADARNMVESLARGNSTGKPNNLGDSYLFSTHGRPTPSTIPWDLSMLNIHDLYDFIVQRGQEPYFLLREQYYSQPPEPRIVYLDFDEDKVSKERHSCLYPGQSCWKSNSRPGFTEAIDLERHYKLVHSAFMQYPCDYLECPRHIDPFTREDHLEDHYKDFHKEDIGTFTLSWSEKELESESQRNVDPNWWRCGNCLDRVYIKEDRWTCPSCKMDCGKSRINTRMKQLSSSLVDGKSETTLGQEDTENLGELLNPAEESNDKTRENLPSHLVQVSGKGRSSRLYCQLCTGLFCRPSSIEPCGHTFCTPCLEQWRRWQNMTAGYEMVGLCPSCGRPIEATGQNSYVTQVLESFLAANPDSENEKYKKKLEGQHKINNDVFSKINIGLLRRGLGEESLEILGGTPDLLASYPSSLPLPTREQCLSLSEAQCHKILMCRDPNDERANKNWELVHQPELIRLYMTKISFPQIRDYMKSKLDYDYKTYANRYKDWNLPVDRIERDQVVRELFALVSDSSNYQATSSLPTTSSRLPIRPLQPHSNTTLPERERGLGTLDVTCPLCTGLLYNPQMILDCKHIFCEPCISQCHHSQNERRKHHPRLKSDRGILTCPLCQNPAREIKSDSIINKRLGEYLALHPSKANTDEYRQKVSGQYVLDDEAFLRMYLGFVNAGQARSTASKETNENTNSRTWQSAESQELRSKGKRPERTVYEEIQEDELLALAAFYGEDFHRLETSPWAQGPAFEIKIRSSINPDTSVTLVVGFKPNYPKNSALLTLNGEKYLHDAIRLKLLQIIETKAKELAGGEEAMIMDIVNACQDVLDDQTQAQDTGIEKSSQVSESLGVLSISDMERELTCSICTQIIYQPVKLHSCLHTFCGSCLKSWFYSQAVAEYNPASHATPPRKASEYFTCPSCRSSIEYTTDHLRVAVLLDMFIERNPQMERTQDEKRKAEEQYEIGDNIFESVLRDLRQQNLESEKTSEKEGSKKTETEEDQGGKGLAENSGSDLVSESTVGRSSEVSLPSTEMESTSSPLRTPELPGPYGLGTYLGQNNRLGMWLNVLESTDILPSKAHDLGARIEFKDRLRALAREKLSEQQIRNIVDTAKQFAGFENETLGFEHLYQALNEYKQGKGRNDTSDKTLEKKRSTQSGVLAPNSGSSNTLSNPQQSSEPQESSKKKGRN